jgi:hypothetical protein
MPLSSAQKLRIKEGTTQRTIHAPAGFTDQLRPIPPGVKISSAAKAYDQLHWFVRNKAELEKDCDLAFGLLKDGMVCWVYFPKGSSGIQTDLTRDKGWECLRNRPRLQWLTLISFNEKWSAFGVRLNSSDEHR